MDTDEIIVKLVQNARPVHRLSDPLLRMVVWLVFALAAVGLSVWLVGPRADIAAKQHDSRYVNEQTDALLTAVTTALAAFIIIARTLRGWIAPPFAPLSLWLASLG